MTDTPPTPPARANGVLASLPRTRPQRSSARRAAARKATADGGTGAKTRGNAGSARATKQAAASARPAKAAGKAAPAKAAPKRVARAAPKTPTAPRTPKQNARAAGTRARSAPPSAEIPVPPQGFEPEAEMDAGAAVNPPSSTELAASLLELVGDVAQSGLSSGGRLLKDVLSRLPGV